MEPGIQHNQPCRPRTSGQKSHGGFTIIELMAVMFILLLMGGLVVTAGRAIGDKINKDRTINNQAIVMSAVEAYFSVYGFYPPEWEAPVSNDSPTVTQIPTKPDPGVTTNIKDFATWGIGLSIPEWQASFRIRDLYYQLTEAVPAGTEMQPMDRPVAKLSRLESQFIEPVQMGWDSGWLQQLTRTTYLIKDGFGKFMDYRSSLGLGGRPVLISAGKDGLFGTADDIRSDGIGQ